MRRSTVATMVMGLMAALALVAGFPLAAAATPPPSLGASYVLDGADALSNAQEVQVQSRLVDLADRTGLDLWVVYVDQFTDPAAAQDWANETANRNNLGPHQYLLAVAVGGRAYYLSGNVDNGGLSADQLTAIEQDRVQPALTDGRYADAAIAAADGIAAAARAIEPAPPTPATSGGPDIGLIALVGLLVLAIAGGLVWFGVRRRRTATGGSNRAAENIDDLARRAGSSLVATDDAVKNSDQELGFARAQFGEEAAAPFVEVLAQARADLDRAFTISQQLDDDVPETPEQRRAGYVEILRLCAAADEALDAKAQAFDELRTLEADAPAALAQARTQHAEIAAGLAAAETEVARLHERYADDALTTVADNAAQARARLDLATAQFADADTALAAGRTGEAAVAIRQARAALAQAEVLERAPTSLGADLTTAEQRSAALVAELEGDLVTAAALPDAERRVSGAAAAARTQLDQARIALAGPRTNPLRALAGLEAANTALDAVLKDAHDAAEQRRRAASQLDAALVQARAQVSAAEDFIAARRGAVGPTARTRLAEAGASLVQAEQLRSVDPAAALGAAQRASHLASEAGSLAQNDVGAFGGAGGGGGGDLMGAVLGGIAINSLLGGGARSRGGFGGGGLAGGFGGFGATGGGRSRSSFGGGARSGGSRSRAGGGRF